MMDKQASIGPMAGPGTTSPNVSIRTGMPTGLTKNPGPIKPKKAPTGEPQAGQNVAQSVFGSIEGLSAASGGVGAGPQIGGTRPPWIQNALLGANVKTSAGPLAGPGDGPLASAAKPTPSLPKPVQGAKPLEVPKPSVSMDPDWQGVPKLPSLLPEDQPGANVSPATPPPPPPPAPPQAQPTAVRPVQQPGAQLPKLDFGVKTVDPSVLGGPQMPNSGVDVFGQPPAGGVPTRQEIVAAPKVTRYGLEILPQDTDLWRRLQAHATKLQSQVSPEHAQNVTPERVAEWVMQGHRVTPEFITQQYGGKYDPEGMAARNGEHSIGDMLPLMPGGMIARPLGALRAAAPAAAGASTVARAAPVVSKAAPVAAEAATSVAPQAAPQSAGWLGRLTAPRTPLEPTLRNTAGNLADPASWGSKALGWVGSRESLPAAVTGTSNVASRAIQPVEAVVGSLLGTRSLRKAIQGDTSGVLKDQMLRSGLTAVSGGNLQESAIPMARVSGVAGALSNQDLGRAGEIAVSPVTNFADKALRPVDQALGNTVTTGDLSRLTDPAKAIGQNLATSVGIGGLAGFARGANKSLTDQQAMAKARDQIGGTWLNTKNEPMTGPSLIDYAMNKATGRPLPPVTHGTPQSPVDAYREFATKIAPDTANKFNAAMAAGDVATAQRLTQEHLQASGGDPTKVMVSMLGQLGPDNFGVPETEFKQMIDGPQPAGPGASLYDKYTAAKQELAQVESNPNLPPEQKLQVRQRYAELNREVQGRAVSLFDQRVMPEVQKELPGMAQKLMGYREKVQSGQTLTPEEAQDLQVSAARGRELVTNVTTHALRKAQLDFGRGDAPNPAAGNADVSTIADVYSKLNAVKPVLGADGNPVVDQNGQPQTEPSHPLGKMVKDQIARGLSEVGIDNPEQKANNLFSQLPDLPKLLLYGGLALSAVGGLGSAFGLFDGGPIMALLGVGSALTGLAGGDPSKLLTKDFWSGLPGQVTSMFSGGPKQPASPGQQTQPVRANPAQPKAPARPASTGTLDEFYRQNQIPVQNGVPQLPDDPARTRQLVAAMSPQMKQEALRQLDEQVRQRVSSRLGVFAPRDYWDAARRYGGQEGAKAIQLREMLQKQGEFKPDFSPDHMKELGVHGRLYGGTGPRLAGMEDWKPEWFDPKGRDQRGWVEWYTKYHSGRRLDDGEDERQIGRWKSFRARHGAQFSKNPTPRRAYALMNWGIDPLNLVPEEGRAAFRQSMTEYRKAQDAKWLTG